MKHCNKIIAVFGMFFLFVNVLQAENYFEFGFSLPIGASAAFSDQLYKDGISSNFEGQTYALKLIAGPAFEWGLLLQPGYSIDIKKANSNSVEEAISNKARKNKDMSISILLDIGYKRDRYGYISFEYLESASKPGSLTEHKETMTYTSFTFDTIQVGLYPKFYYGNWAFGFGGGVKIPIYFYKSNQEFEYIYEEKEYNTDKLETHITGINALKMKDVFKSPVIWYIKLSADYSFYSRDNISCFVGGYLGYDFLYHFKINSKNKFVDEYFFERYAIDAIDLGTQFGIRFKSLGYNKLK